MVLEFPRLPFDGRDDSEFQDARAQVAGNSCRGLNDPVHQVVDGLDLRLQFRPPLAQPIVQPSQIDLYRGEVAPQIIVDFPGNSGPFLLLYRLQMGR